MKPIGYVCLIILSFLSLNLSQPQAHMVTEGRGTQSLLVLWEDRVQITFNVGFGTNEGYSELMTVIDKDHNQDISPEERDAYINFLSSYVISHLSLYVDGKKIPIRVTGIRENDITLSAGKISDQNWALDFWFDIEGSLRDLLPAKWHILEYQDLTFNEPGMTRLPMIHVSYNQHVESMRTPLAKDLIKGSDVYTTYDRMVTIKYSLTETLGGYSGVERSYEGERGVLQQEKTVDKKPEQIEPRRSLAGEDKVAKSLARFLEYQGFWAMLAGIFLAVIYGAYHSLMPGHGKTLLVAYAVGTKGRIRDAVILGTTMVVAHTGVIIFVALLSYYVAERYLGWTQSTFQTKATLWTGILSGLLIIVIGIWLLIVRAKSYTNGHKHDHPPERKRPSLRRDTYDSEGIDDSSQPSSDTGYDKLLTTRGLISLGISGGIVPCPTAIMILLVAFATRQLFLGLVVLIAFSAGLGGMIVGISIVLVKSRSLIGGTKGKGGLFSKLPFLSHFAGLWLDERISSFVPKLPMISAIIVILIGFYIFFYTLIGYRIIILNL